MTCRLAVQRESREEEAAMTIQDKSSDIGADLSETAQKVAEIGRDTASRAAAYVRDSVDQASDYAQELTDRASDRIADATGRNLEEWGRQLLAFVEQSPIKALVVAVAAGYLIGRVVRRA